MELLCENCGSTVNPPDNAEVAFLCPGCGETISPEMLENMRRKADERRIREAEEAGIPLWNGVTLGHQLFIGVIALCVIPFSWIIGVAVLVFTCLSLYQMKRDEVARDGYFVLAWIVFVLWIVWKVGIWVIG